MTTAKILVVEDEMSIQNVMRTYLESAGYDVIIVASGPEALAQARQTQPDLVILDLNLPGMDGMEVAARLRQESDVYIMMLTALYAGKRPDYCGHQQQPAHGTGTSRRYRYWHSCRGATLRL